MINHDNAVTRIASAVARLGAHEFPLTRTSDRRRVPDRDHRS